MTMLNHPPILKKKPLALILTALLFSNCAYSEESLTYEEISNGFIIPKEDAFYRPYTDTKNYIVSNNIKTTMTVQGTQAGNIIFNGSDIVSHEHIVNGGTVTGNTTFNTKGVQNITNGKVSGETTFNSSGIQMITAGKVTDSGVVNFKSDGMQKIDGIFAGKVYFHGEKQSLQSISGTLSGHTFFNTKVAFQGVTKLGTVSGTTTFEKGGTQEVKGTVSGTTTFEQGGTQNVNKDGTVSGITTFEQGGTQYVRTGGTVSGQTSLNNGAIQNVEKGGKIFDTFVDGIGSKSTLESGAISTGKLNITNGGELNLKFDDSNESKIKEISVGDSSTAYIINTAARDQAWEMKDKDGNWSKITNTGTIQFNNTTPDTYTTLTVGDFDGAKGKDGKVGKIVMNTDLAAKKGDKLIITGTLAPETEQKLMILNKGDSGATKDDTLVVVETQGSKAGQFALANANAVEVGGYHFYLRQTENKKDWELYYSDKAPEEDKPTNPGGNESNGNNEDKPTNPGGNGNNSGGVSNITSTADAAANALVSTYLANFIENQTLLQRMGELRDGSDYGVWGRMYAGKFKSRGNALLSGFDMKYHTFQLGADYKYPLNNASLYLGGAFSYMDADQDFDKSTYRSNKGASNGDGTLKNYGLSLYATYQHDTDWYIDSLLRYNYMKNKFNVYDTAGALVNGKYSTNVFSASVELGKRYYFTPETPSFYVTPQAQLTYSHFDKDTVKASNGLNVTLDSRDSFIGRLGAELGYQIEGVNPKQFYFRTSYLKEFSNDGEFILNTSPEHYSMKGSWWNYEIGATTQFNQSHHIYINFNYNHGKHFNQRQINLGYRYTF